jgi:hypothetical protein
MTASDAAPDVSALQAIFDWCREQKWSAERLDERPQIVALCISFGDFLCPRIGARWVWAEDAEHSDVALQIANTQTLIWPFAVITKRILQAENTTIQGVIEGIEDALQKLENDDAKI